ncbi:hypothetical protein RCG17_19845 [Neobacillus sp. PS3-12]|uniref:hypothetical protein n=1 Tax=Neobacillus sp. PS3-12 TaxID=3070677 RepID=UPI0027E18959|nr:hypothetical protein [Neobacillus sp. PS3-12]WML51669.1 hypothetical protein RCG17_19845 [Neobacillus sp. PS3-12]
MFPFISNISKSSRHLSDEAEHYKFVNIRVGKVYGLLKNDDEAYEGKEMIQAEDGNFICSFSLFLNVKWMKIHSENEVLRSTNME